MTRLWFVRHGPTHAKGMVGWSDLPADLSDKAAIARLSDHLPAEALLISSDLIRCVATADVLGPSRTRLPHDPDLREIHFGDWELRVYDRIMAEHPDLSRAFWDQPGDVRAPGGETWNETRARVDRATDRLIAAHTGADIIIVAHFGAILTQLQRALDISGYEVFGNRIDNLSVTQISFDEGWSVNQINHIA